MIKNEQYTFSEQEVIRDIVKWLLCEVENRIETGTAVYGLQNVFRAAFKYELDFELTEAENIFFRVLENQIEHEEGGALAKHYFKWLFHQNRRVEISQYLQWIESHYQKAQTPYVLKHLIRFLSENVSIIKPTTVEIEQIWCALKLLIVNRLEHEGTTLAAEDFVKLCHQKTLNIDKAKLGEILSNSYQIYLQMNNHERVIYLLINFLPFWQYGLNQSISGIIVDIWRKVSSSKYKNEESFGKLTRVVNDYLQKRNEKQSISDFHEELISYIERNQSHTLSAKFTKILILARYHFDELSMILPRLIESQRNLEDIGYAIGEYLKWLFEEPPEKKVEYETSILKALEINAYKPYSALCLRFFMECCTSKVHYALIEHIIEIYLEKIPDDSEEIQRMLKEYYNYGKKSEIDELTQKDIVKRFLLAIQSNILNTTAPNAYSVILEIWGKDIIPHEFAASILSEFFIQQRPTNWEDILGCCYRFKELFGSGVILLQVMPIGTVCELLKDYEEVGFIFVRQQLRKLTK